MALTSTEGILFVPSSPHLRGQARFDLHGPGRLRGRPSSSLADMTGDVSESFVTVGAIAGLATAVIIRRAKSGATSGMAARAGRAKTQVQAARRRSPRRSARPKRKAKKKDHEEPDERFRIKLNPFSEAKASEWLQGNLRVSAEDSAELRQKRQRAKEQREREHEQERPREQEEMKQDKEALWKQFDCEPPELDLQEGEIYAGRCVGISLMDGLKVDVSAAGNAPACVCVPVAAVDGGAAALGEIQLGDSCEVRIEKVHRGERAERYRFPVIASINRGEEDRMHIRAPLRFQGEGAAVEALAAARPGKENGDEPTKNEVAQVAEPELEEEVSIKDADFIAAQSCPSRPPPKEVLSWDPQNHIQKVPVERDPEEVNAYEEKTVEITKTWEVLLKRELDWIQAEESCRQNIAKDVDDTERALAAGLPPPLHPECIGLTKLKTEKGEARCVIPVIAGDRLGFRMKKFKSKAALQKWMEGRQSEHQKCWKRDICDPALSVRLVEKQEESARQLARFFECGDIRHFRASRHAEASEIASFMEDAGILEDLNDKVSKLGNLKLTG